MNWFCVQCFAFFHRAELKAACILLLVVTVSFFTCLNFFYLCRTSFILVLCQPQRRRKRENERKKNSQRAAHFCKVRCRHRKTDVVKLNWNDNAIVALVSKILVFINGDRRDFDFVGNTHTETHIYSFLGIFTFGLCVLLQWKSLDIKIVCSKDYLHVGITIKVTNFSNQSFITNTCHDTLSDSRLHALFLLPENSVEFELRVHIM